MAKNELLAGLIRVLVLNQLSRGEGYGYGIAKAIEESSGHELTVKPESLYPVLHRMEADKLVSARWVQSESGRPRKMYSLTAKGRRRHDKSQKEFIRISRGALNALQTDLGVDTP